MAPHPRVLQLLDLPGSGNEKGGKEVEKGLQGRMLKTKTTGGQTGYMNAEIRERNRLGMVFAPESQF